MVSAPNTVIVGIAQLGCVRDPGVISTCALGSCVGVVMYDPTCKVAGMVHIMMPDADEQMRKLPDVNKAKYANLGITELLNQMLKHGATKTRISAKMAGGARMFGSALSTNSMLNIGERNIIACKSELARLRIPVLAEDLGGTCGRSVAINTTNGMLMVRTVGKQPRDI